MLTTELKEAFFSLVRLGIGNASAVRMPENIDWHALQAVAIEQGLSAIIVDGLEKLPVELKPPKPVLLQWIGEVLQEETVAAIQQKVAREMALLFHHYHIRTYVLKGAVVAECYPNIMHRSSVDLDCYLAKANNSPYDAWEEGNQIIEDAGYEVKRDFYKNSTFIMPGLTVENHQYLTPFRGNKTLKALEKLLQSLVALDNGEDRFEGTWLYRPPVMVSALFLIEHAYSHFLHEGLTWKHVLDWMMYSKKHDNDISWKEFHAYMDEFGLRKFYEAYLKLGYYLLGVLPEDGLNKHEKRMLYDVWAPLDLHESDQGLKGKLALAGNTWRARWKYRYFSEISMIRALWIQTKGVVFIKHPTLV